MENKKILIIDDDQKMIDTYLGILSPEESSVSDFAALTGIDVPASGECFDTSTALQGQDGVALAEEALSCGDPFSVAFIDMRMPPGWDGLMTAKKLRELDSRIYIVIVTAYTDKTVDEIHEALERDVLLLRKPFNRDEIYQMARTLVDAWNRAEEKRRVEKQLRYALKKYMAASGKNRTIEEELESKS